MAVIPAPSHSASPGHPTFRRRRPLPDEMTGVILVHGVEPVVPTVEAGRRGEPRVRLDQAVIRQGALPRQLPPRPHPSAARARSGRGREGPGVPRAPPRLPHRARPPAADRTPGEDSRRRHPGPQGLGRPGMKIPEQYGGLGLTQVYYNKALAMAGTW